MAQAAAPDAPPAPRPRQAAPPPTPATPAETGRGAHGATFDRAYYDFQAVGEFVVVRSTAGDPLEVQARQAPLGPSRTVSVNSAVAFRLGTHTVELSIGDGVTQVRVDGKVTAVPPG